MLKMRLKECLSGYKSITWTLYISITPPALWKIYSHVGV